MISGLVLFLISFLSKHFYQLKEKLSNYKKYRIYILCFIIFAIISNFQVNILENKFNNLYGGISETKIVGTIISDRKETSYKVNYMVRVESINSNNKFKGTNLIIYMPKKEKLEFGDKIIINGVYEKASTAKNFKAFDYREYLKTKNVYGVVNAEEVRVIKKNNLNFILIGVNNLKTKIKFNLIDILGKEAEITERYSSWRHIRDIR